MLKIEKIPKEYTRGDVDKMVIGDQNEVQWLHLDPCTAILMHDHDGEQWEAWIHLAKNRVYLCMKDEEHELVNDSHSVAIFMAIKGRTDYTYDELAEFFFRLGFSVYRGSVHLTD